MVIGCPYSCTADPCPGARAHHRLLQHTLTEPETKGCCCWRRQCDLKIKKKDRCFCAALSLVKEQTGEYKRPCGSYCGDGGQSQFHVPRSSNLYINDSCQAVFRDHELEEPEREANRHERRGQNTSTGTWHSGTAERERKRTPTPPTKGHISFLRLNQPKTNLFIPIRSSSVFFDHHSIGRVFMPRGIYISHYIYILKLRDRERDETRRWRQ